METTYQVLRRAIVDPSFRERLTKDPRRAMKSVRIRMTQDEFSKMTEFMRHVDLAQIKDDAELQQKLGQFKAGAGILGVRGPKSRSR